MTNKKLEISIHALREESDLANKIFDKRDYNFNPRSPRGERRVFSWLEGYREYISIHALREESDSKMCDTYFFTLTISIHALREESDFWLLNTPSIAPAISIHALREESDAHITPVK